MANIIRMMLDIFLMLGVLIPLIASNFFFNEVIKPSQWLGVAVLLVAVGIMCSYNNSIKAKTTPSSFVLVYILIMAFCLFANFYFKTVASRYLSAVLLYPLNQGCALILSAIMASVLFKERITVKAVIGIATAFTGLLIINLL